MATSDRSATAWKLTLKDESGTFQYERTDKLTSYKTGEIVKINVTEISSQYDHITAMVLDDNNTVLSYGAIGNGTGEKTITIPYGVDGTQIKFFAEKWNGDNKTD